MSGAAQTILNAVAFIPAANALDSIYARQCLTHIDRRGYRLFAILREWSQVIEVLGTREVQVIVLARRDHLDPDLIPRIEFVGEETRELSRRPEMTRKDPGRNRDQGRPRIIR